MGKMGCVIGAVIVGVIAVLALWAGSLYNGLVGAQQEVEEVEAAGARLQRLVRVDRGEQLALEQRREVRVGAPREVVERGAELGVRGEDVVARHAAIALLVALARSPELAVPRELDQLGLEEGAQIRIRQGRGEAVLATQIDAAVPPGVVRVAAAHPSTCGLEGLSGPVTVEKA